MQSVCRTSHRSLTIIYDELKFRTSLKDLESNLKHFINVGLQKWQFKPNWEKLNHDKYDELIETGAIITAECIPICPGYNLSYLKASMLESVYVDMSLALPAWVDYAKDFGIEFHS